MAELTHPRVLIIDDNPLDCKVLQSMLSPSADHNFTAQTAYSLESALQILKDHTINVILLDLNLPDSQGLNTLTKLSEAFPFVAIVINTGEYEEAFGPPTLGFGAQDFLSKGKYDSYILNKSLHYAIERKKIETELRLAYSKLKETQSQLIQSEKMHLVGKLASGVAHEVKNPLATILYGIDYLTQKMPSDEKVVLTLKSIKDACHKAIDIIRDLLDFAGLSDLKINAEELRGVIEKSVQLIQPQLEKNKIKVNLEYREHIPPVSLDRNRMEQVLVDVMLNAIQAMPTGGELTIKTSLKRYSPSDNKFKNLNGTFPPGEMVVVVEVEDTGSGIPKEIIGRVFDPFFTTKRAQGGIGLGLSVAHQIMTLHKGHIHIENRQEGGARVTLMLKK
jgi:signal transduction histidine kinase